MMSAPRTFHVLLVGTVVGVGGLLARTARAAETQGEEAVAYTKLAIDLEYLVISGRALDSGPGGGFRLGREFAGLLSLTPEIGGSYHSLNGVYDASLYRGFAGFGLSIGTVIKPGVFGHLGYGHIAFRNVSGPLDRSHSEFTYDAGVTLDYTLLPVLDVGAHAAYNGLSASHEFGAIHWISTGGQVSVRVR
jgi:hypothetical protein